MALAERLKVGLILYKTLFTQQTLSSIINISSLIQLSMLNAMTADNKEDLRIANLQKHVTTSTAETPACSSMINSAFKTLSKNPFKYTIVCINKYDRDRDVLAAKLPCHIFENCL